MVEQTPAEISALLRMDALAIQPEQISSDPAFRDVPAVGVLMEIGYERAVATLAAFIDGNASIYFSTGGSIVGDKGYANVRIAARRFTQFAGIHLPEMSKCTVFPMPEVGQTVFYVLTSNGVFTHKALQQDLNKGTHNFSPLFQTGQYLFSQLKQTMEKP
jgi:hypothetical protein